MDLDRLHGMTALSHVHVLDQEESPVHPFVGHGPFGVAAQRPGTNQSVQGFEIGIRCGCLFEHGDSPCLLVVSEGRSRRPRQFGVSPVVVARRYHRTSLQRSICDVFWLVSIVERRQHPRAR